MERVFFFENIKKITRKINKDDKRNNITTFDKYIYVENSNTSNNGAQYATFNKMVSKLHLT